MSDSRQSPDTRIETPPKASQQAQKKKKKSLSMHEDVPVWYDSCSCQAEPYWLEVAGEMETEVTDCEGGD